MALFKKTEPVQVAETVEEVVEKKVEAPKAVGFQPIHKTLIGKGITFEGDFISDDPIEIKGAIHGNINCDNLVTVFENGEYRGIAKCANIDIIGYVNGNVQCGGLTAFAPSGKMEGNLKTSELRTDVGTSFEGSLVIDHKNPVNTQAVRTIEETQEESIDLSEEGDVAVTEADIFE